VSNEWDSYFYNVNGKLASIALDMGIRAAVPDEHRPHLLWVWVYLKSPRDDGFPIDSEFPILAKIEDKLAERTLAQCDAIQVGRITTDGRREFYFYGSHSRAFPSEVAQAMGEFPDYQFDLGDQLDARWKQYLEVLFPPDEVREKMENLKVLENLQKHGDTLEKPREVRHWICFSSDENRENFWQAARQLEYRLESKPESPNQALPLGLCIARVQSVKRADIDEAVLQLYRLAKKLHGDYDGWETQVVKE